MHVIFLYFHEGLKVPFYTKQLYNLWKPTIYLSAHLRSRVFTSCRTILCSRHKHTDQSTLILPHSNWILTKFWHSFISAFLSKRVPNRVFLKPTSHELLLPCSSKELSLQMSNVLRIKKTEKQQRKLIY